MKCFIDGNQLCIVRDDFINLQESSAVFIKISKKKIKEIEALEKEEKDVCKYCGCTDEDCHQCIDKTGGPCSWTVRSGKDSVCSRCYAERESAVGERMEYGP